MKHEERIALLKLQIGEAREKLEELDRRLTLARTQPPSSGNVVLFRDSPEQEWVVVRCSGGHVDVVAADTDEPRAEGDVLIPDDAIGGRLVVRCHQRRNVPVEALDGALLVSLLEPEHLEAVTRTLNALDAAAEPTFLELARFKMQRLFGGLLGAPDALPAAASGGLTGEILRLLGDAAEEEIRSHVLDFVTPGKLVLYGDSEGISLVFEGEVHPPRVEVLTDGLRDEILWHTDEKARLWLAFEPIPWRDGRVTLVVHGDVPRTVIVRK
ncbi:MAG: hypothetical protein ABIK09_08350 [Pseudomonadota bacterium]